MRRRNKPASGPEARDLKGGRLLSINVDEGGEQVSFEILHQHALDEEVDGGNVSAVLRHFSDSSAASEQAGIPALAIDDTRARVPRPGEHTRLGGSVARQDGDLLRHLARLALEVDPGERTGGVEASDDEVGGVAALNDHNTRFPGYLNQGRFVGWVTSP
jgi:hypothetical protein